MHPRQAQNGPPDSVKTSALSDLQLAIVLGGGIYPTTGRYSVARWSNWTGKTESTIRSWIAKYNIPNRQIGDEIAIEAEDFWTAFPLAKPSERPKPQRGGNRHKSTN